MGLFDVKEKSLDADLLKQLSYEKLVEFIKSQEFKQIYYGGKINGGCSWLNTMIKINVTESNVNEFTLEVNSNNKNGFSEYKQTIKFNKK